MAEPIISREKIVTIIFNGIAVIGVGLSVTGWINPVAGVCIMSGAVLYWIWEILTLRAVADQLSGLYRILIAIGVITILALTLGPLAIKKIHSEQPKPPASVPVMPSASEIADELAKRTRSTKETKPMPTSRSQVTLACSVATIHFEPFYRFFQDPPVYFQRLDTAIRVSVTNRVGKSIYPRGYSVSALVGTGWVQFKNADSAAFEPYAFGVMGIGEKNAYLRRFDLSANGFDYVMKQRPLNPDENLELWMFFISGLSPKDLPKISQFKFIFRDSAGEEFPCTSAYSTKNDKGIVIGISGGDLKVMSLEPTPPNIREEPPH